MTRKKQTIIVDIVNRQERIPVETERIEFVLKQILLDAGYQSGRIEVVLVDDPTIHELNVQFLGHDYATDVLSFEMDRDDDAALLEGNVIVSTDTAADRAAEFKTTPSEELFLYMVHGTLHLVGYDDHTPEDAPAMRDAEKKYTQMS
ncbi:MAG: rRNA maturation RNase YbeY [Thermoguttaceae bacterium]|nr:rRNA maturation RNase YbeY [Thermoguttaceae bacterium]